MMSDANLILNLYYRESVESGDGELMCEISPLVSYAGEVSSALAY